MARIATGVRMLAHTERKFAINVARVGVAAPATSRLRQNPLVVTRGCRCNWHAIRCLVHHSERRFSIGGARMSNEHAPLA